MYTLLDVGIWILRLVPLILLLYIPALLGMAIWSERGEGYRIKALLWFVVGLGAIVGANLLLQSDSLAQFAEVVGLSVLQITVALLLARLTVYRLAD